METDASGKRGGQADRCAVRTFLGDPRLRLAVRIPTIEPVEAILVGGGVQVPAHGVDDECRVGFESRRTDADRAGARDDVLAHAYHRDSAALGSGPDSVHARRSYRSGPVGLTIERMRRLTIRIAALMPVGRGAGQWSAGRIITASS